MSAGSFTRKSVAKLLIFFHLRNFYPGLSLWFSQHAFFKARSFVSQSAPIKPHSPSSINSGIGISMKKKRQNRLFETQLI